MSVEYLQNEPLSGEESLEEARKRMHRLLDDAFTLISPRASFQENDLRWVVCKYLGPFVQN